MMQFHEESELLFSPPRNPTEARTELRVMGSLLISMGQPSTIVMMGLVHVR